MSSFIQATLPLASAASPTPVIAPVTPSADAPPIYALPTVGSISKAKGEWQIDWARAKVDAALVLSSIDFSQDEIIIWVPGTSNDKVHPDFLRAVKSKRAAASIAVLRYEASWHMRKSLPTGIATLLLVLEEIQRRGRKRPNGPYGVLLGGESQGAWVIGEAAANRQLGSTITRATLLGHPWLAAHQYTSGEDARVRVINHEGDQVTLDVKGDVTDGLDAMIAIRTLKFDQVGTVARAIKANPEHGVLLLKSVLYEVPGLKSLLTNPHDYSRDMEKAAEFLLDE